MTAKKHDDKSDAPSRSAHTKDKETHLPQNEGVDQTQQPLDTTTAHVPTDPVQEANRAEAMAKGMNATGGDPPLPLDTVPPGTPIANPRVSGSFSIVDIVNAGQQLITSLRNRDIPGIARSAAAIFSLFADVFPQAGGGVRLWGAINPQDTTKECDKLLSELDACKGEVSSSLHEFANPDHFNRQASGSPAGLAASGPTSPVGVSPSFVLTAVEMARLLIQWFRDRSAK